MPLVSICFWFFLPLFLGSNNKLRVASSPHYMGLGWWCVNKNFAELRKLKARPSTPHQHLLIKFGFVTNQRSRSTPYQTSDRGPDVCKLLKACEVWCPCKLLVGLTMCHPPILRAHSCRCAAGTFSKCPILSTFATVWERECNLCQRDSSVLLQVT